MKKLNIASTFKVGRLNSIMVKIPLIVIIMIIILSTAIISVSISLATKELNTVTASGFDEAGVIDDSDYLEIKVNSSTRYIRYDSDTEEFTPYALGTEDTKITLNDLRPAEFYGSDCSKILVTYVYTSSSSSTATPTAKFIVIYQ